MAFLSGGPLLVAQAPTAPTDTNLIHNGNFASYSSEDNLWDGVDSDGYLAGFRQGVAAISEGGFGDVAMPESVAFVDMNGDGLPDLVVADPVGIYKVYFNSGTKTEPKFTHCEILPIFPALWNGNDEEIKTGEGWMNLGARKAPKIFVANWFKRAGLDLLIGDYIGEFIVIPNTGSVARPEYKQADKRDAYVVNTADGGKLWSNLLAPAAYDLEGKGQLALLLGEGAYSANAVHLFVSKGTGSRDGFKTDDRHYLAYGDGRELLVPTMADYNGDGLLDLLVADREGTVGVYLNPGNWKPGVEMTLSSYVMFAGTKSLGSPISVCAADYNGDGLFDLLIGKANGRIAVAINKGTKEQPQFDMPVEIKGEDVWGRTINSPTYWECDTGGLSRGNFYSYFSVVSADEDKEAVPPVGTHALKAGFFPCLNKFFPKPGFNYPKRNGWTPFTEATRAFYLRENIPSLQPNKRYTLRFKVKGRGTSNGTFKIRYHGAIQGTGKIVHGARGSVSGDSGLVQEWEVVADKFSASSSWGQVTKTFTVEFKNPALKGLEKAEASLELRIEIMPYDGVCYYDDVRLEPAK